MPSPQHASSPYASPDPGFPALSINELLAQHTELIARIKLCHGSDRATFDQSVRALIERFARLVHLLPATPDNYFCDPGGLLRLGMEVAFFSLQGTDAHIFSGRSTISARRHLEPRWGLATFIAGLCSEVHRVLTHVIVTDGNGAVWPGYLYPLSDWLTVQHADRYFLRWRPHAVEARGLGLWLGLVRAGPGGTARRHAVPGRGQLGHRAAPDGQRERHLGLPRTQRAGRTGAPVLGAGD